MFKQKKFLRYSLIALVSSSFLHEVRAACTDLNIFYENIPPIYPVNWTASVWYTPCGQKKEAILPFYASKWKDNHLSIEAGTRVRIGKMTYAENLIDEKMSGNSVQVQCWGTVGLTRSDDYPAKCKIVPSELPAPTLQKCTNLVIDYVPGTHWTASVWYTPCDKFTGVENTQVYVASKWTGNSVMVQSGTKVQIGPKSTFTNYCCDEAVTGATVNVCCSGKSLGSGSTCKVLKPGENCPKSQ